MFSKNWILTFGLFSIFVFKFIWCISLPVCTYYLLILLKIDKKSGGGGDFSKLYRTSTIEYKPMLWFTKSVWCAFLTKIYRLLTCIQINFLEWTLQCAEALIVYPGPWLLWISLVQIVNNIVENYYSRDSVEQFVM